MEQSYFSDLMTRTPELFKAIVRFNGVGSAYENEAFQPTAPSLSIVSQSLWRELWQNTFTRCRVQSYLVSQTPFWDFLEESRRLVLLEQPFLARLADYYGAGLHAESIARSVAGEQVRALQHSLGQDVYDYAVQRAQYQRFGGASLFVPRHSERPLEERVLLHGQEALSIVLATWPDELQKRCALTLPASFLSVQEAKKVLPSLWSDLKRILLREVYPQWASCFV